MYINVMLLMYIKILLIVMFRMMLLRCEDFWSKLLCVALQQGSSETKSIALILSSGLEVFGWQWTLATSVLSERLLLPLCRS